MHLGGALHLFWLQGNSLGSRIEAVIAQCIASKRKSGYNYVHDKLRWAKGEA